MSYSTLLAQAALEPPRLFTVVPLFLMVTVLGAAFFGFLRAYKNKQGYYETLVVPYLRVFAILMAAVGAVSIFLAIASAFLAAEAVAPLILFSASVSALATCLFFFGLAKLVECAAITTEAANESAQAAQTNAKLLRQLLRAYGHEPEV
jgi:hypothetical protein